MTTTKDYTTTRGRMIPTSELREGDVIRAEGAVMQLGPISEKEPEAGRPEAGAGLIRWANGYLVPGHPLGAIPLAWTDRHEDGRRSWPIQGNDRRSWELLDREGGA